MYLIQAGTTRSPIKIGYTGRGVEQRLAQLQVANSTRLHVIAAIPGDQDLEQRLHERFASGRLTGEWFDPDTPGLQEFISDAIHFEGFYPRDLSAPAIKAVLAA